jgi:hypothetical protein
MFKLLESMWSGTVEVVIGAREVRAIEDVEPDRLVDVIRGGTQGMIPAGVQVTRHRHTNSMRPFA